MIDDETDYGHGSELCSMIQYIASSHLKSKYVCNLVCLQSHVFIASFISMCHVMLTDTGVLSLVVSTCFVLIDADASSPWSDLLFLLFHLPCHQTKPPYTITLISVHTLVISTFYKLYL